jgi:hypothetical protein
MLLLDAAVDFIDYKLPASFIILDGMNCRSGYARSEGEGPSLLTSTYLIGEWSKMICPDLASTILPPS